MALTICEECGLSKSLEKHYGCPGKITDLERDLIAAVRSHALQNYTSDGWDFVVECWEDKDIHRALQEKGVVDVPSAIRAVAFSIGIQEEQRNMVIGTDHEFNCGGSQVRDHPTKPGYKLCGECGHYWQER